MIVESLKKRAEQAIADQEETRYSIAKGAGIDYHTIVKWLDSDANIKGSTIDKLAAYFGLTLCEEPPKKK